MLLTDLSAGEPPAKLQLRLQHLWRLCNPVEPDKYFALGTAWTDAEVFFPELSRCVPSRCLPVLRFFPAFVSRAPEYKVIQFGPLRPIWNNTSRSARFTV
ncbi:hypothetical protein LINGRAHAP2_LOCUS21070 [Linum grandiflorum]